MGTNALPAAIEDDLSREECIARQLIIAPHTRARCALNSYGYFCEPQSAGLCGKLQRAIAFFSVFLYQNCF